MPIIAILYGACAAIYAALIALILVRARLSRTGVALAGACAVTAAWSVALAIQDDTPLGGLAGWLELARGLAWYGFVLHLYRRTAAGERMAGQWMAGQWMAGQWMAGQWIPASGLALAALVGALPLIGPVAAQFGQGLWTAELLARLGVAICNILLIENLYFNTPEETRWHVNLPCIALGSLFLYDLVLYSDALLFRRVSLLLFAGRASVTAIVAPLLAVAAARNRTWKIEIHVSRTVVFHSASLVMSGIFLLALAAAGEVFRRTGAEWGIVAETTIIFGGLVLVAVLLTSGSARSRLRALVVEHFFSHRYDYRREWIRCIETLSAPGAHLGLQTRAIRAVTEVVDSPAGMLFVRGPEDTSFLWAGSWNMPAAAAPIALADPLVGAFRGGVWVVELASLPERPGWMAELPDLWLAVPLNHVGQLIGFVLVARSRAGFRLEREAYDLLRIVGREVASRVAEQRARQMLAQNRALQEYSQRFAFVIHDIKNVSSQLSMLLANAEVHADNPEFQRDMLKTVRASVARIGALLGKLQMKDRPLEAETIVPADRVAALAAACGRARGAEVRLLSDGRLANVAMEPGAFDAVVTHLIDNALDATADRAAADGRPAEPVTVSLRHEPLSVTIDISDKGPGMSPEFVRDRLFVPFASTKPGGHGIGAYQARELMRAAGGDLLVITRPDVGTTMRVRLPSVAIAAEEAGPATALGTR